MSEMVERVATAICAMNDSEFPDYDEMARAAIEAMREMTPAMIEAGARQVSKFDPAWGATGPEVAKSVWSAMIDAALKDSP